MAYGWSPLVGTGGGGKLSGNSASCMDAMKVAQNYVRSSFHGRIVAYRISAPIHEPRSSGRQSAPSYPKRYQSQLTSAATIQGSKRKNVSENSTLPKRAERVAQRQVRGCL